jgi:3-oxoacyl-[acyl-carrier-protein] synthase III
MRTIEWLGNCVAASIPVTLYDAVRKGRIQRGDEVLLVGSGAGLSLGGMIITY